MGVFSTTSAPDGTTKSFVKLAASGTLDDVTTGAAKTFQNTTDFAHTLATATHVWIGVRFDMGTTQPTLRFSNSPDFDLGYYQRTAGAGALTGAGPWTGALNAVSVTAVGPMMWLMLG